MNQVTTNAVTVMTNAVTALQAAQAMIIQLQNAAANVINPADIHTVLGELKTASDSVVAAITAPPPAPAP